MSPLADTSPPSLASKRCALSSRPPWLLIRPLALLSTANALSVSALVPSRLPPWLLKLPALTVNACAALIKPCCPLLSSPVLVNSRPPRLVSVPPLLSTAAACALRLAPATKPLTLVSTWSIRSVRPWLLRRRPLLLSRLRATILKAWPLEISPAWLFTPLRWLSTSGPVALMRPCWLLSWPLFRSRVRPALLNSLPAC